MAKAPMKLSSAFAAMRSSLRKPSAVGSPTPAAAATPALKPLYRRLFEAGASPGEGMVADTMREWLQEGRAISSLELLNCTRQLRKYKHYHVALQLIDWLEENVQMSSSCHAVRLDLIAKVKGINSAETYFSSLPDMVKNKLTYGALLNCYCGEKLEEKALSLFDKMKELNIAPNLLNYNSLMTLQMKLGHAEKVPSYFQEMVATGIIPDSYSYCLLVNSYASQQDLQSVEGVMKEAKAAGLITLRWPIYSNLAARYNSAGLYEKSESTLKTLEEVMDKRDRDAYHHLITLYAGAGNLAEVKRVWNLLKAACATMTNRSYLIMLRALHRLDDIDGLKDCFNEWEYGHSYYDASLLNVVVKAYLGKNMAQEAVLCWKNAIKKNVGSHFRTFELFIEYYLENNEIESAMKLLDHASASLEQGQWKPKPEMVHSFLKYFKEAEDARQAETVCKNIRKFNCLDRVAYEFLLETYLAAGKKDPSLYQMIEQDGIEIGPENGKLLEMVCKAE